MYQLQIDLIIQRDERIEKAMTDYLKDDNEIKLVERLHTCSYDE